LKNGAQDPFAKGQQDNDQDYIGGDLRIEAWLPEGDLHPDQEQKDGKNGKAQYGFHRVQTIWLTVQI
jgi:hypothetical protein